MSFYTDDDFYASVKEEQDEEFVCINCGGTESYVDGSSGLACCSSCYTQSQTQTQQDGGLEVEEIQGLAARTRTGQFKSAKLRTETKRKKKPLEELDKSAPLPDLETCLNGMQQVLKGGIQRLSKLLDFTDEQTTQMRNLVFKLWKNYLTAWMDGAEFYGKLHPEVRFCLRDSFTPMRLKLLLMRQLSYKSRVETLKAKKIKAEEDDPPNRDMGALYDDSGNDTDQSEESIDLLSNDVDKPPEKIPSSIDPAYENPIDTFTRNEASKCHHEYSKIQSVLKLYPENKGRKEAALMLQPSLTLCASFLWISIQSMGYMPHHLVSYIANGTLPFLNAFDVLLSPSMQKALKPLALVFRMSTPPSARLIERYANILLVACGYKFNSSTNRTRNILMDLDSSDEEQEDSNGKRGAKRKRTDARKPAPSFSLLSPELVPLVAARLIKELGLGQDVLDVTLALMGNKATSPERQRNWLPAPLPGANAKRLKSRVDILSVIMVACKMSWAWESWSLRRAITEAPFAKPLKSDREAEPQTLDESVHLDAMPSIHAESNRQNDTARRDAVAKGRFVPWTEAQFRLVGNGKTATDYLDFLNETYLSHQEESAYKDVFDQAFGENSTCEEATIYKEQTATAVRPNEILAGAYNPNRPQQMWKRQKYHDWYLTLGKRKAMWADANGLGEYVIYKDKTPAVESRSIHYQPKRNHGDYFATFGREPLHPHYALLLEYMAYTTHVEPHDIHEKVTALDQELKASVKPKPQP